MNSPIQIFLEYKIKPDSVSDYENHMASIISAIEKYEVEDIHWYEAADQKNLYVEMFKVPTMSYYHSIKNLRQDKNHPIFGEIDQYIDGGLKKLHCWAFIPKLVK